MRILVLSDSHSRTEPLLRAINSQPEAKHIFFLGDNVRDIEQTAPRFSDRKFYIVRGNCDGFAPFAEESVAEIDSVKIFYCHGHTRAVKGSTGPLKAAAERAGAKIALFGHTHSAYIEYENGIYLVNPGSVSRPRSGPASYAVIDITPSGIMPIIIPLNNSI